MMSQPASRLHHRLAAQDRHGLVVLDIAGADDAVMAVRGERVERHVAQHAEIGQRLLQRRDRPADEVVGVERLAAFRILKRRPAPPGNTAIVGMPSSAASPAASTSAGIGRRKTPGIEAIGALWPSSWTKTGQIRSPAVSTFSATSLRDQASRRLRRSLRRG